MRFDVALRFAASVSSLDGQADTRSRSWNGGRALLSWRVSTPLTAP